MRLTARSAGAFVAAALMLTGAPAALAQAPAPASVPTKEELAKNNELFLDLARSHFHWEEPAEPFKVVGPLHFVGTRGLGVWLFATPKGHILLNTGMPSSGPMIVESMRKLGFDASDIRVLITGHAHVDHAGALAFLKQRAPGAELAIMREDVQAIEDGGKDDFRYGADWRIMGFPPAKVDRVLRDGDTVRLGEVVLTARHTPGHTRGATTWSTQLVEGGRAYTVVFPGGGGFNPGYRLATNPSYPGIADDYRRTLHTWEMLTPDIWLAQHNEYFDLEGKRRRAETEGLRAWIDPEGYRRFVAGKRRAFEAEVDEEMGAPALAAAPDSAGRAPEARKAEERPDPSLVPVTVESFPRAESDLYFARTVSDGGFGKLRHRREMTPIDAQDVVRMNRDTLYSSGVFDLDAAPLTVTLPDPGKRFMSLQVVSEDHYVVDVAYAPGKHVFTRDRAGTRYVFVIVRTLVNPIDPGDMKIAHALQDSIRVEQASAGAWQAPAWDPASQAKIRDALVTLNAALPEGPRLMFGAKSEVDPIHHLIGSAAGWGGNPRSAAVYESVYPERNDGRTAYALTVKDLPVDGFWSISVYDARGYFAKNDLGAYSLNSLTAKPDGDGSFTIRFGGPKDAVNHLPITPGWNYTVRMYRPRKEVLDGAWTFPRARPVE